jgi:hypothetical protein
VFITGLRQSELDREVRLYSMNNGFFRPVCASS